MMERPSKAELDAAQAALARAANAANGPVEAMKLTADELMRLARVVQDGSRTVETENNANDTTDTN